MRTQSCPDNGWAALGGKKSWAMGMLALVTRRLLTLGRLQMQANHAGVEKDAAIHRLPDAKISSPIGRMDDMQYLCNAAAFMRRHPYAGLAWLWYSVPYGRQAEMMKAACVRCIALNEQESELSVCLSTVATAVVQTVEYGIPYTAAGHDSKSGHFSLLSLHTAQLELSCRRVCSGIRMIPMMMTCWFDQPPKPTCRTTHLMSRMTTTTTRSTTSCIVFATYVRPFLPRPSSRQIIVAGSRLDGYHSPCYIPSRQLAASFVAVLLHLAHLRYTRGILRGTRISERHMPCFLPHTCMAYDWLFLGQPMTYRVQSLAKNWDVDATCGTWRPMPALIADAFPRSPTTTRDQLLISAAKRAFRRSHQQPSPAPPRPAPVYRHPVRWTPSAGIGIEVYSTLASQIKPRPPGCHITML
ncbi:uncharacterized protein MYCFIDRAFT_171966 [Pseudocercospora fijiensis CIRAD86]|uniref:Uncharacterized protein n=1 Tax=Pseudocercospora fijiensis (strain CIRAD86) TaxID=383855 RepID=M3ANK1_PSEFD|nr:uncharacterized protein MYCFIDRAFT_171966 [Pseudocercospora fijiensis CIRAD86]EME86171.1 hypothetical protein MYCFIDRAFT_171966 [Pseudocercospora fijiensis CIRAD86]